MASKGDAVECHCGAVLRLENDRVPWHRKPPGRFNCHYSGVGAEGWDAVAVVPVGGVPIVLACPACGDKSSVANGPSDAMPLLCRGCGAAGTLAEFAEASMNRRTAAAGPKAKSTRYGART